MKMDKKMLNQLVGIATNSNSTKKKNNKKEIPNNISSLQRKSWLFCYITSVLFLFVPFLLISSKIVIVKAISASDASLLVFSTICSVEIDAIVQKKEKIIWMSAILALVSIITFCGIASDNDNFFCEHSCVINSVLIILCFVAGINCYPKGDK